jgi:RecB family endonuclease NucS
MKIDTNELYIKEKSEWEQKSPEIPIERELEDLILQNSELLLNNYLLVNRQIEIENKKIDILGISSNGNAMIIEVKLDKNKEDPLNQAYNYCSLIKNQDLNWLEQEFMYKGSKDKRQKLSILIIII